MVVFTIDIRKVYVYTHRLQKDDTFKEVNQNLNIQEGDTVFEDYDLAEQWMKNNPVVYVDDEKIYNESETYSFGSPSFNIRQHRTSLPQNIFFTKEEVANVLENGDDEVNHVLVVDYDGIVHLLPECSNLRGYAVRFETFIAGKGYVGSTGNLRHLDETYRALLDAWVEHLHHGDEAYRDYDIGKITVEELKKEAEALVAKMRTLGSEKES
ncbi:hypothetical protein ACFVVQ_13510 [Paenibacillus chitinolyticus]|uniref:hypothetical protein n=1 Tax=Paenibacillus chitinolyticus TaxID=79263 RepID=UPI0036DB2179